jgi:hypothetical protein
MQALLSAARFSFLLSLIALFCALLSFGAMLLMALSFWAYTLAIVCYRVRSLIIERERHADWVQALPEVAGVNS